MGLLRFIDLFTKGDYMATEIMRKGESFKGIQENWIILENENKEIRLIKIDDRPYERDIRLNKEIQLVYREEKPIYAQDGQR